MNLRLPLVATVVTAAVAVAAVRAVHHSAAPVANVALSSDAPTALPAAPLRAPRRAAPATVRVYVAGDVVRPGVYAVPPASRAEDALHAAGGASRDADLVAVNLAEPVTDGEEIVVPVKGAEPIAEGVSSGTATHPRKRHRKRRARRHRRAVANTADDGSSSPAHDGARDTGDTAPAAVVDVNDADENELETLPGIGPALASRIVAFREVNGPFASADDLLDVGGMTQGRLDAIEPYVSLR